ncbi:molybdopterin-dependent oxidoreductase [uncultured Jatrophihabitans sp.]|uniref:molybdopterin-dependent oxidoreductase n=1 Tax=uncultured Jatrophihabitans sp. TaxID=1610747 RepID=UPI0035CB6EEC
MLLKLPQDPPALWPRFRSPLRSVALTARVGRVLGICFAICFVTGLLSHYQYHPWSWLPEPSAPVWLYRFTQGLHVTTGTISIPLLLVKLWSVYPNLFRWPLLTSVKDALERLSIAVLVSSALVELVTGYFNVLNWYPWSWDFTPVHRYLGYVVIGSLVLHIAIKLPAIKRGLATRLATGSVLTEQESDDDDTPAPPRPSPTPTPPPTGISRRGALIATGAGVGLIAVTQVGQTITPLEPIGLLAVRQHQKGPAGVPINRTADQAAVQQLALRSDWTLQVRGPKPYELTLDDILTMSVHEASFPISCVEGWSVGAHWRGLKLLDVVRRAGGNADSQIEVRSLEPKGSYNRSFVHGPQVPHALLATHINGERLNLDHGYPLRLIAPDRAGVLNTKWLTSVRVL